MKALMIAVALCTFAFVPTAKAWDCTTPGQVRVQVPTGTVGAGTGDGSGQVVTVQGLTFECEPAPTSPVTNNSNTNKNVNNNVATATGGNQKQKQTQQQSQSISNSGNSSSASSATSNGDNSNNTTEITKVPRQVATALAPPQYPTSPCFKGISGAAQGGMFGVSAGGGKIDQNCAIIETAKVFAANGSKLAYCKTMLTNKFAKKAGITLEDCMGDSTPVEPEVSVAPAVTLTQQPPVIEVNVPAPVVTVIQEPAPVVAAPTPIAPALKKKTMKRVAPPCTPVVASRP